MRVVLAEKPSVARELASFLGADTRREGYFEGRGYQVTWALGHLATLKEPDDYDPALKKWSLETLPFAPERFELKPRGDSGALKQLGVIRKLLRGADEVVCATDAGREGELIFRYIQELCGCVGKPTRRLWLSSLTESAIREAFGRLRPLSEYDALYAAARCRSEADWVVGLNATRYYTVRYRSSGRLWSVGRVQTPVLAMIVRRDDEIRTFQPEPFWELLTRYRSVTFKFAGDRFTIQDEALGVLDRIREHPFAIVGVDRKPERIPPPQLHDLTELQREMNRRFGFSADATLKAAQSLYEAKIISYPRTDSRYLGSDMRAKIPGILEDLRPLRGEQVGRLDLASLAFSGRLINDAKVSDHHAIIPTGKKPGNLAPALQKVFDAIVTRLIAAFYPTCVKEITTVSGLTNQVPFRARGVRVVDPGWTVLDPRKPDAEKKEDEQELPEFRVGESGPHEPSVREGRTSPPKPYTEGTLLGAMETAGKLVEDEALKEALKERGLGTPATRAAIIETLLDRGYIVRDGKALAATDLGRYLVAIVRDRGLKSPELTGEWEAKLREIERGRLEPGRFMAEILRYTGDVVRTPEDAEVDPSRLGDCPRCGLPVIAGKKGFGCSGWKDGCRFTLFREYRGLVLDDAQIRELIQRRVLARPLALEGAGEAMLQLSESGALMDVPVPAAAERRFAGRPKARASAKRSGAKPPRRTGKAAATTKAPDASPPAFATVAVGACPLCGSEVVEGPRSFGCSGRKNGCGFAVWKTIAGKKISVKSAQALLKSGRTPLLKGFESKAGKPFDARLKLEGGEVRFDFGG
ncbi:type IA DNA topoisomerase [Paludisphaera mucosa]|uniref:DNA topoisomerase n=1 Tax=Paludisphaera mucosa TaxID=3030827 RepID=A0ABT6FI06_9BACT|nr:type IA DNA topoisomerase [Paludisphaera mucosa]MDG3007172.1 DNA topoisomerase 3 [Paludisphaera mucosa]